LQDFIQKENQQNQKESVNFANQARILVETEPSLPMLSETLLQKVKEMCRTILF